MKAESQPFVLQLSGAAARCGQGFLTLRHGRLLGVRLLSSDLSIPGPAMRWPPSEIVELEILIATNPAAFGPESTVLFWDSPGGGFAVMPATVPFEGALEAPDIGVRIRRASRTGGGHAAPAQTAREALAIHTLPRGRQIGWDTWERMNRAPDPVPTVLGLSRDQRLFVVDPVVDGTVTASLDLTMPTVVFDLGRISSPERLGKRTLMDGCLPILNVKHCWGDLFLEECFFATLGEVPLKEENLRGTPLLSAHLFSRGCQFPQPDWNRAKAQAEALQHAHTAVLYHRVRLENLGAVPVLASQALPCAIQRTAPCRGSPTEIATRYTLSRPTDPPDADGVVWTEGVAHSMHRVNGSVPDSLHPCMLLAPGESMTVESVLAHSREGLGHEVRKGGIPWGQKLEEARQFWQNKLSRITQIDLPDPKLSAFWRTGFLHLDLITLGLCHDGPLLAKVGVYPPIGSESLPILEFFQSVGQSLLARRCLDGFFALQQESGRINLFAHYDIETGAALFLAGRYFACTEDIPWVRNNVDGVRRAAQYILSRRTQSDPEDPRHGLEAGTCADPRDATTAFMLNAFNAAGLAAASRILEAVGDPEAEYYCEQAALYAERLRHALRHAFRRGPLLPTAPRRWVPTCAPWVEGIGPRVLGLSDPASCFSHRTNYVFDALLGPLWAVYLGLVEVDGPMADWLLEVNHRHFNRAGLAESQPYYSRHPEIHLLRGERDLFLNAFYSGLTGLADRETFTFWEHFHHVSLHKTHEEGWALMQLRRMLWVEVPRGLRLLAGIPEAWTDAGRRIQISGGHCTFGSFSLFFERHDGVDWARFRWEPAFRTVPEEVTVDLPGLLVQSPGFRPPRLVPAGTGRLRILQPELPLDAELSGWRTSGETADPG